MKDKLKPGMWAVSIVGFDKPMFQIDEDWIRQYKDCCSYFYRDTYISVYYGCLEYKLFDTKDGLKTYLIDYFNKKIDSHEEAIKKEKKEIEEIRSIIDRIAGA
jgi:hypothetical protein